MSEIGEAAWTARDLFPSAFSLRGDRTAQVHAIRILVAEGLRHAEIATELGISLSSIRNLLYDPDGSKAKALKNRYRGTCRRCGHPTSGSNGVAAAPTICRACYREKLHEERFWTAERITEAFRQAAEVLGRPPAVSDAVRAPSIRARLSPDRIAESRLFDELRESGELVFPAYGTVVREFGSWKLARRAAGLPSEIQTGRPSHRGPRKVGNMQPPELLLLRTSEPALCPSCGEFVRELGERTGWCRSCTLEAA